MEWKSLLAGLLIGALMALPLGMATGVFKTTWTGGPHWGFGPGRMAHGYADGDMYAEMEEHMVGDNFTQMHEEMGQVMEGYMAKYMGAGWEERHEYCERLMGIEEDE
ncbi:hypothetical protein [Thermococcus sp. 21S7]|uniref:hypothetical protein n=1 Tax=Thermococcus sp. 21S7 TaxID=1638221 RepID=UPI00143AB89A|nr:hypothetical protein [Thermococcus sp. 21S7]NJE61179.1 hypothetical protein [Thermococcus sp. 21S7]